MASNGLPPKAAGPHSDSKPGLDNTPAGQKENRPASINILTNLSKYANSIRETGKIFFLSAAAAEALASVSLSLPAAAAPPRRTCFSGIWPTAVLGSGPAAFLLAQGSAKAGRQPPQKFMERFMATPQCEHACIAQSNFSPGVQKHKGRRPSCKMTENM